MKIGVVSLHYGENYEAADDLVAGYIVAVLRKAGYTCNMCEIWSEYYVEDFKNILHDKYDLIFWTIPTTSNIPEIMNFCEKIKQENCAVNVLVGWDHHSAPIDAKEILHQCKAVDAIVIGEGEKTVINFTKTIENGEELGKCPGIMFESEGRIICTDKGPIVENLDELPFPARETILRHNYKVARISSARGCLGNCSFCPASIKKEIPIWRGRTPENIVQEIKEIITMYNIKCFMFIDPTFEDPGRKGKERIRTLAELIIREKLDITFLVNVRAENWSYEDEELLDLLFLAGLESVTVGIESGSEKCLKLFNKRASVSDVEQMVRIFNKKHVYLAYGFIMFHPFSDFYELRQNNRFLYDLKLSYMFGAYFVRLKAFPGTNIYKEIIEKGYSKRFDNAKGYTLYDYTYEDKRIERLATAIQTTRQLFEENENANYYSIQKIITFCSRLRRKILSNNVLSAMEELSAFENEIEEMKNAINETVYQWFEKCIVWAETEGDDDEFQKMNSLLLEDISAHMMIFNKLQIKHGKRIVSELHKYGIKI